MSQVGVLDSDVAIARTTKKVAAQYLRAEADKLTEGAAMARAHEMPRIYVVVHRTLMDRLERYREVEAQQISLREELSLYRAAAQDAIESFGKALEMREAYAASSVRDEDLSRRLDDAVASAAQSMRDVLESVQGCAVNAARVEQLCKGNFSVNSVRSIVTQISRLMYEVCGEEHVALAEELERRIMRDVRVTVIEEGTSLTPDMDVREMDATIPLMEAAAVAHDEMLAARKGQK